MMFSMKEKNPVSSVCSHIRKEIRHEESNDSEFGITGENSEIEMIF